jgi:hypothetical protein
MPPHTGTGTISARRVISLMSPTVGLRMSSSAPMSANAATVSLTWRHHLEPADQHEGTGQFYVADLRAVIARRGHDSEAIALVDDLRQASPEFGRIWDQHNVSALYCTTKAVHEPRVGWLDLDCAVVTSPLSQQRLLLLRPVPGTPAKEWLERLARSRLATYK